MWQVLVFCLASGVTPSEAAAAPPAVEPLGVTISGGASLGAWEAGFMYLTLEALKAAPSSELRIATGASAGSANALVSALSSCLPPNPDPLKDPGWNVWGPVGFKELFDPRRASEHALFITDPMEAAFERVRTIWEQGLPESCDVVFGASVTRVVPRLVALQEGLSVPRALETFVVRIQGRGPGRLPRLTNYVDPQAPSAVPLLVLVDEPSGLAAQRNFSQLGALIVASAAFPVAFRPKALGYCLSKPASHGAPADLTCAAPQYWDFFLDGGVFDNNPLRLAWNVAERRLQPGVAGRSSWSEATAPSAGAGRHLMRHLSLDPAAEVFPVEAEAEVQTGEAPAPPGFLTRLLSLGGGLIQSARSRELVQLVSERPGVADRVHLVLGNLPKASEHITGFMGLFERDFRLFDFYLGMYDAFVDLRTSPDARGAALALEARLAGEEATRKGWAPLACILAMAEPGFEAYLVRCQGPELENFRVLLQVSLDLLYQRCRRPDASASRPHHHCALAAQGFTPPGVPGVRVLPATERGRSEGESRFDGFMRLLAAYGFEFKDLGLPRDRAGDGRLAIRWELDQVVDAWAASQPGFSDRIIAKSVARTALNNLQFSPPALSGYVTVGTTIQAGMSIAPFGWTPRWLQVNGALGLGLLETVITESRPRLAIVLSAGPEFHLPFLSSSVLQPRLAVRGGVQFSAFDSFGAGSCQGGDPRDCTQGTLELVAAVTVFERLRLHGIWETFPGLYGKSGAFYRLQFGVGFQFL